MVSNMAPSRVIGGMAQSSANSGIFFQGDGQSQNFINSHMSSSFGNSTSSIPGTVRSNLGPASGDINQTVLNSVANSASSIGASSLVTDANSAFSGGGPQLHRSASISMDSYMRLPTSPMSFTSNNISVSGSSIIDGSSTVQQNSHHDPNSQHVNQSQQHLQQGTLAATSLPTSQNGQVTIPMASRIPNTLIQDPTYLSPAQKKPRLDIKQEDFVQQQVIQQLLQRDPMQLQSHNPQFQAFIQQQRLRQQQQILQAMPQMQRAQLHQQQLRQQLQQQNMQQMPVMKNPHESGGICARRLMQYLFHQRKPTENNTISYWRSFVKEYYAPRAKKRWCLSQYENVANQGFGVFPQATMDAWHCDICGSKSGKGFEATYEVLPRLNEIKFSSGVIDELLFLDIPHERRAASGLMMLEYAKAVQETVYEQARIVREGHLRIIFTQDLKILSYEFCARRHEELLPRRIVASQVNQLLQVAQKCQSTSNGSGSEGVSTQDLQSNSNMMVNAGRQLAKSLELQSLNDLGFSKRFVRSLQIAEVVNSMKDLMDFCRESKAGPIEGLKNYPRHTSSPSNLQLQKMQEIEQLASMQGLPTDRNTLNKLMAMQLGINNHAVNNNNPSSMASPSADNHASALPLSNCQSILTRQSSINSNPGSLQQEASSSHNNSHPSASPSSSFQGPSSVLTGSMQGGFPSPRVGPQQQQQRAMCANVGMLQNQHPRGNQTLQQQMIQQLLHDMSNNNRAAGTLPGQPVQQQRIIAGQHSLGGFGNNSMTPMVSGPSGVGSPASSSGGGMGGSGPTLNKCSSFKTTSNSDSSAAVGTSSGFNPKVSASATQAADMSQNLHLADEMVQELTNDFTDNGYFSSNLDDALGYGWKA